MTPTARLVFLAIWLTGLAVSGGGFGCGSVADLPFLWDLVAGSVAADPNECAVPIDEEELVAEVIRLVNQERISRGLNPVEVHPLLKQAAGSYACTMISDGYFGHYHPTTGEGPGDRATAVGYQYRAVGENLAAGQRTPAEVMEDWMNSTAGHRENILNPMWIHIGVAVRKGGPYGTYWVLEFGAPWRSLVP